MGKRNGLWHEEALALADRYSPATIALIVHVSERQVRNLLAGNLRGAAVVKPISAPAETIVAEIATEGDATVKSAARALLESIVEPHQAYEKPAPRRAEAVAALAGGATVTEAARQLGCRRESIVRMRDSAALAGEIAPPADDDHVTATKKAKRGCDAHLADLIAVYGPHSPFELPIPPGPARFISHGGYQGSGSSSPAAACADIG